MVPTVMRGRGGSGNGEWISGLRAERWEGFQVEWVSTFILSSTAGGTGLGTKLQSTSKYNVVTATG